MNLKGDERAEYFVVPSTVVARICKTQPAKTGNIFYAVHRKDMPEYSEAREKVFGASTPKQSEADADDPSSAAA